MWSIAAWLEQFVTIAKVKWLWFWRQAEIFALLQTVQASCGLTQPTMKLVPTVKWRNITLTAQLLLLSGMKMQEAITALPHISSCPGINE